ncbi:DUF397 domain-containing protein [Streptomyces sp.]|uniref:DUF397 domain-containing protein n=1 Tax=Streptomyces sp. TaxID=1931 RepID=UPI002D7754BF|nr:DUF397 domain-containing protein [Streptomyces sp.]HET6359191.1 DUF397 domain-containing protein [Streptomyces sp.]
MSIEPELEWFKSSYSSNEPGSDCVEVAGTPSTIHVRDSKNTPGPQLAFPSQAWADFVSHTANR